ncbi:CaiF/GrlA family transcriptional regulator [Serratia marcescens]|uniref:CaiF/GrlA family transcriptional regulator n=1 Tax=Serratia marcescens TaxID=615 RepID=UPI0040459F28
MTTNNGKGPCDTEVPGRQSNYGVYRLPDGLQVSPSVPLYQVVALWGWRLGRPFSREELAVAFHIELRRAGDVMSYIRRASTDRIVSRQHYVRVPGGVRMRYLHIIEEPGVEDIPVAVKPVSLTPSEPADDASAQSLSALKRWFIGGAGKPLP